MTTKNDPPPLLPEHLLQDFAHDAASFLAPVCAEFDHFTVESCLKQVGQNCPAVFRGAVSHWPALSKWKEDSYLCSSVTSDVEVNVTPDGLADSANPDLGLFMMPEERRIPLSELLACVGDPAIRQPAPDNGIYYLSKQCGNLVDFPRLQEDVDSELAIATAALGRSPDAVNLWVGDERSITTVHKDPYENFYAVICGAKHFTLLPPTSLPLLPRRYLSPRQHKYSETTQQWHTVTPNPPLDPIPWITLPNAHLSSLPSALCVSVFPGDLLYLPAEWFHRVQQTPRTIAVNYWYDQSFGLLASYNRFLDRLIPIAPL